MDLISTLLLCYLCFAINAQNSASMTTPPLVPSYPTNSAELSSFLASEASMASALLSSEEASLFPTTNADARACRSILSLIQSQGDCISPALTITFTDASSASVIEKSCYCKYSTLFHNKKFSQWESSCATYLKTAFTITTTSISENSRSVSFPTSIIITYGSSSMFSVPSIPSTINCKAYAATARTQSSLTTALTTSLMAPTSATIGGSATAPSNIETTGTVTVTILTSSYAASSTTQAGETTSTFNSASAPATSVTTTMSAGAGAALGVVGGTKVSLAAFVIGFFVLLLVL